jgi:hypothetical protein
MASFSHRTGYPRYRRWISFKGSITLLALSDLLWSERNGYSIYHFVSVDRHIFLNPYILMCPIVMTPAEKKNLTAFNGVELLASCPLPIT